MAPIIASSTNRERAFVRDMSYSHWHRQWQGLAYIDIDSVEICKVCKEPIALIELARDVNQDIFRKNAMVTTFIAKKLGINCYVLLYSITEDGIITRFRAIQTAPVRSDIQEVLTPEGWVKHLHRLHGRHEEICGGIVARQIAA